jgi:hypothetical protein
MNSFDSEDPQQSSVDDEVVGDTYEENKMVAPTISEPDGENGDDHENEEEENYDSDEDIINAQCEDMEILRDSSEELVETELLMQNEQGCDAEDQQNEERTIEKRKKGRSNVTGNIVFESKRDRKSRTLEGYVTSGFQSKAFREKIHKKRSLKQQQLKMNGLEKAKEETKKIAASAVTTSTVSSSSQRRSGRRARTPSEKLQPKLLSASQPVVTEAMTKAKEKQLNEQEDSLISSFFKRKAASTTASTVSLPRKLPEGHTNLNNLSTAITTSMNHNTSLLLPSDWKDNTSPLALIGWICKVYWDGEEQWYYARILNYDFNYHRYYVRKTLLFSFLSFSLFSPFLLFLFLLMLLMTSLLPMS